MSQTFFPAEHHFDEWLMIKNDFKNQQTSFNFKQLFMVFVFMRQSPEEKV